MPRLNTRRDSTGPELARMTGAFGQQLSFAQRIMESGACSILLIDMSPDPLIQYASPGLETLTGYAAQELLGRRWTLFFAPTDPASVLAAFRLAPEIGPETRIALSARTKSGATLHLDATVTPLRNDAGLVTHRVLVLRDVAGERLERSKLEYRAHHDPLTGLANRYLLRDRFEHALAHARRHGESFAILVVDLNGFKLINDRLGHDAGDALLGSVSKRLQQVVRAEDTVARLGGDEFVLMITEGNDAAAMPKVMDRLRDSLSRPFEIAGGKIAVGYCAGLARFPDDGSDLTVLLKVADGRLYSEKERLQRAGS